MGKTQYDSRNILTSRKPAFVWSSRYWVVLRDEMTEESWDGGIYCVDSGW